MANSFGNGQSSFQSHMTFREGAGELSESRYNLLIGATLTWGFFLNFLIMQFAGPAILNMVISSPASYSTFMIGFLVAYIALVLIVTRAALVTAIITLIMMIVSTLAPSVFQRMGTGLGVALLGVIVVESIAMLLFRMNITFIDWIVVGIMCLYIGFDWVRANSVQRTATNAIAAASALYLDIINIFLRVLRILARSRSND